MLAFASLPAHSQQTVLNVPSADVLERGKTYFEWDFTAGDTTPSLAATPRSVRGIGHGIETGFNLPSLNAPGPASLTLVPIVKWEFYNRHGIALFTGDHVFLPVRERGYTIGNSDYLAAAYTWRNNTRIAAGAYDFTAHTMDRANRAGIQASIEQTINPRLALATDWYSGNNSVGYVTSGLSCKVPHGITLYSAYEMGNHDLLSGNHSLLFEFGWNPDWGGTK
jgi:hypothetical protein